MIPYEVIKEEKSDKTRIKCGYCSKIFETVQQHEQHRCRKESSFSVECLSCKKPYNDHSVAQNEEKSLQQGDLKETESEEKTATPSDVETTSDEQKTKSQLFGCCVCNKIFPNIANMVRHIKYHLNKKTNAQPAQCGHCDKTFSSKQQLTRHEATHNDVRVFKCEECLKMFKTADGVKRHMYIHSDARPFSCRVCSKEFKAKHLMKKHEEIHSDEKNYECPKCGKRFKARNSLRDHLLVHNGTRPYKCDVCDQAFYRRSHLATHKITHSEVKPYACKVCAKSFGRREHLKVHERIHSGEKPFQCGQCERSFNQQAGLQAHRISHSDDRPYTCLTCKKTFKYQAQTKHHACKPDEIGPCMVNFHSTTNITDVNDSESPTALNNSARTTASQEGQETDENLSTAENSNATSTSEDTIIFIQIQNTPDNDDTAMSVDIVTTRESNNLAGTNPSVAKTNISRTNTNTGFQLPESQEETSGERRHSNTISAQASCDKEAGSITMTPKDSFGSVPTARCTRTNREETQPSTTKSQAFQSDNLIQQANFGWSHGRHVPLVSIANNLEQATIRDFIPGDFHRQSAAKTAENTGINPEILSVLPAHLWNHS